MSASLEEIARETAEKLLLPITTTCRQNKGELCAICLGLISEQTVTVLSALRRVQESTLGRVGRALYKHSPSSDCCQEAIRRAFLAGGE